MRPWLLLLLLEVARLVRHLAAAQQQHQGL
jgi:hypothetical protein